MKPNILRVAIEKLTLIAIARNRAYIVGGGVVALDGGVAVNMR